MLNRTRTQFLAGVAAMAVVAVVSGGIKAQQPAPGGAPGGGRGGAGGGIAPALFTNADANRDGAVTRGELMSALERWFGDADTAKAGSITPAQLSTALTAAFPTPPPPPPPPCGTGIHTPCPQHVTAMTAALPDKAYAKPARPRKLLVYGIDNQTPSHGFVHSSIAIQAAMVKAMGDKLGTWSTTISYDPSVFTTENLKQYDAVLLNSTTGCFLDQPGDKATTDARRAALLAFVREGKGLGGIHASTDSYHSACPNDQPAAPAAGGGRAGGGAAFGGAAGRGGAAGPGAQLSATVVTQADKNTDQRLTMAEMTVLANEWFDKMDTDKSGRIAQTDFAARYAAAQPAPAAGRGGAAGGRGAGPNAGATPVARGSVKQPAASASWPEWTKVIGGYFKYHWNNGTHIPVKVDDPKSPLTQMFGGKGFDVIDETYTFAQDSFSRTNVHVLTSVDYDKMPQATKDQEPAGTARTDGDYALSYIRREGKGRVFYEASGHDESIYAMKNMSQHYLALLQYALGDLKADDSPSVKAKK
jgi:type 1 glutamine amidotransferase